MIDKPFNGEIAVRPDVKPFFDPATSTITYVVSDPETGGAAIIDSVLDYDPSAARTDTADALIAHVRDHNLSVQWHLETHAHADHLSAAPYLQHKLGGAIAIGERITVVQNTFKTIFNAEAAFATDGRQFDHLFSDGDTFRIEHLTARAMHKLRDTPACITYLVGNCAFVGDRLFRPV